MAKFHVGQRVRVISSEKFHPGAVGHEAVIIGHRESPNDAYWLEVIGYTPPRPLFEPLWARGRQLAPLTDPSADRFIESIKRLGREPINDAPKVTVSK